MTALGIALLIAGAILLAAEVHVSGGLLGAAGVAMAAAGTAIAVDASGGGIALALVLAAVVGIVAGAAVVLAVRAVSRTSRGRIRSGAETLVGMHGRARAAVGEADGLVLVDGAVWRARNELPHEPIEPGDPIVVERVEGLTLTVRRAEPWELTP